MDLITPFTTSFSTQSNRDFLIVEAHSGDLIGYGECGAFAFPYYSEEYTPGCQLVLKDHLVPLLVGTEVSHPAEVRTTLAPLKRNNMAKAAVEGAIWDLWAKHEGTSLAAAIGGTKPSVEVGLSVGIKGSEYELVEFVSQAVDEGFARIKIKIKPGTDLSYLRAVRKEHPDVPLMADANSAYTLDDVEHLRLFDDLNLMMIEQPLAHDDIVDHRHLQKILRTPICLDESIHSLGDARKAIELGSCRIINIKIGRVGGISEAKDIEDLCRREGIDVWCGGMLESGIGRAHNLAIASLPGFTLPGDTAPSARYWDRDVIIPEVTMDRGSVQVPAGPGIGFDIDTEQLEAITTDISEFEATGQ
nr:o-succinylbenzoate synthase [Brevibacterium sp. ZH18]